MIAASESGSGKTSIALAFMNSLRRQGFAVYPFKCGPDYIDTVLHQKACGQPSYNLDTWITGAESCRDLFRHNLLIQKNDVTAHRPKRAAVVEGVMGLFDGAGSGPAQGKSRIGSPAFLAKTLGIPVILVLNAKSQGHSIAALAQGFANFDPELKIAGLLVNKVGSPKHAGILREALREYCPELPLLGLLPRRPDIAIPERYLGLELSEQQDQQWFNSLGDWLEEGLARESLSSATLLAKLQLTSPHIATSFALSHYSPPRTPDVTLQEPLLEPAEPQAGFPASRTGSGKNTLKRPRIGIARDAAFSFHYVTNHLALEHAGAELVFFSPMHDHCLPPNLRGLWLGGGYPELHARTLSGNTQFLGSLRDFCAAGFPVWSECGGFSYLCNGIKDITGQFWPLAGVFNLNARIEAKRQGLGYVSATFLQQNPVCPVGQSCRGHIFHYTMISDQKFPDDLQPLHHLSNAKGEPLSSPGCIKTGTRSAGSFLHLMLSPGDNLSRYFVETCSLNRQSKE